MEAARPNPDRPLLLGRYTLLEKLGAGGHGEVWRAHDATLGIEVALKVLSPALARSETAWEALEHEHEIAGRLDHPSILKVYSPQRDAETAALPMELAPGGDLRRLRGGSYLQLMPPLLEIAAALKYAHEQGVIHRDLKPGNVLFDAKGRAVLADFGVAGTAFAAGRDKMRSGLSPFTSSPEQLRGDSPTISDDIYGLGALLYELLAGQPPYYPHFDVERVLDLEEPVPELRTVQPTPPQLVAIVMRMLQKHPESRPASMQAVIDDFDSTMNDTLHFEFDAAPQPQTPRREPPRPAPRPLAPPTSSVSRSPRAPQSAKGLPASGTRLNPGRPPIRSAAVAAALHGAHAAPPMIATSKAGSRPGPATPLSTRASAPAALPAVAHTAPTAADPAPNAGPRFMPWDDLKIVPRSGLTRLEPIRSRRWPWVVLALIAASAAAAFYLLPRYGDSAVAMLRNTVPASSLSAQQLAAHSQATPADIQAKAHFLDARSQFDRQLAALESRGAATWGGQDFFDAKMRSAEALGADEAGDPVFATKRLAEAQALLSAVETRAPSAQVAQQLAAAERALAAGRMQAAKQAFETVQSSDPTNRKAAEGLQRIRNFDAARPLLADAANAESAGDMTRALGDYQQAVALDPRSSQASAGLARARATLGDDGHAGAAERGAPASGAPASGAPAPGAPAPGAPRIEEARTPATVDTAPVDAALPARSIESVRQRALSFEAQERWDEALNEYETALKSDPSLAFAQQGKARVASRALLAQRLQALIDRPELLATAAARADALALIENANEQNPSGPVLRSQAARLQILLPAFDTPVHVALTSDGATLVAIPSIGFSGVFSKREIQLKPGKYTVVGTRDGYREVRRDITIAPGQDVQSISVSCGEPI